MNMDFTLLIADRNRNVRNLLQREMTSAGYRVCLAENAHEIIKWAFHQDPLDLIILDPDLPDGDDSRILDVVLDRIPAVPVIVHTHISDFKHELKAGRNLFLWKKEASVLSIETGGPWNPVRTTFYPTIFKRKYRTAEVR